MVSIVWIESNYGETKFESFLLVIGILLLDAILCHKTPFRGVAPDSFYEGFQWADRDCLLDQGRTKQLCQSMAMMS